MPLRADSSHQPCLPAPFLEATLHCQATQHSVSASPERKTIHGLCQRASLYVDKKKCYYHTSLRKKLHPACFFFSTLSPFTFSVADTKRKVEQISEELKNLDEMLAGKEGADGPVDTSEADGTSPAPHGDPDQTDTDGTFFFRQNHFQSDFSVFQTDV